MIIMGVFLTLQTFSQQAQFTVTGIGPEYSYVTAQPNLYACELTAQRFNQMVFRNWPEVQFLSWCDIVYVPGPPSERPHR